MKSVNKLGTLLVNVLLLISCNTAQWKSTDANGIKGSHNRFWINVPPGWKHQFRNRSSIVVSRDGLSLQFIKVAALSEKTLQIILRGISRDKKKVLLLDSLLPSELAGLLVSVFKNIRATRNIKLIESGPAIIGKNIAGFRVSLAFKKNNGLQVKRIVYGYVQGLDLVIIMYQAPALYYFPRDLKVFKLAVASFKKL